MAKQSSILTGRPRMYRDALDHEVGRLTYSDGKRVYGHRRLAQQRRQVTTEMLKAKFSTAHIPQSPAVPAIAEAILRTTRKGGSGLVLRIFAATVLIFGGVAAMAIEGTQFGALVAGPLSSLWRVAVGRIG